MKLIISLGFLMLLTHMALGSSDHRVRVVRDVNSSVTNSVAMMNSILGMMMPSELVTFITNAFGSFGMMFQDMTSMMGVLGRRRRSYDLLEVFPFKFNLEKQKNSLDEPMIKPISFETKKMPTFGNPYVNFSPDMQDAKITEEEEVKPGSREEIGVKSDWNFLLAGVMPQFASTSST